MEAFPIRMAMNTNLTINMGSCNYRKSLPHLVELVAPAPLSRLS